MIAPFSLALEPTLGVTLDDCLTGALQVVEILKISYVKFHFNDRLFLVYGQNLAIESCGLKSIVYARQASGKWEKKIS